MPEITDQQLIDAGTDATNYAAVVNGAPTDPNVVMRSGVSVPPLAKQAATIAKGDKGDAGAPGPVNMQTLATYVAILLSGHNLCVPTAFTSGFPQAGNTFSGSNTSVAFPNSGYVTSGFIPANAGGNLTTSLATLGGSSVVQHFDGNKTWLRDTTGTVDAGGQIACAADEGFVRIPYYGGSLAAVMPMVMFGNTTPGSAVSEYLACTYPSTTEMLTAIAAALVSNFAGTLAAINARLPLGENLFDNTRTTPGLINTADGSISAVGGYYVSAPQGVLAGVTYNLALVFAATNPTFCAALYDANNNVIETYPLPYSTGGAPQNITPTKNGFLRFCDSTGNMALQQLTVGNAVPGGYTPFMQPERVLNTALFAAQNGKRLGLWGDSITALYGGNWLPTVLARTGMVQVFQDARAGRNTTPGNVFENYGGASTGVQTATMTTGGVTYPTSNFTTGTVGNTVAQNIANVDVLLIGLGTNDQGNYPGSIGTPGDAGTVASYCGYLMYMLTALRAANKNMRIVMWTPYLNGFGTPAATAAIVAAQQGVALLFGIPVINMMANSGISSYTEPSGGPFVFTLDGTHPSPFGGATCLGPCIAGGLQATV